jgi:hypothetical protein
MIAGELKRESINEEAVLALGVHDAHA